ncbi:MAG: NAD(P)H-dependent oxidoreductase [Endozoicomonadaceae bacterium]|nr:NAD(P)H-dependent oxidoreductase [Endozoicomonadaceae bacterium]
MVKILFFAGSTRKDSINKKLAKLAEKKAKALGAIVTYLDLKAFEMPLYDGDLEKQESLPDNAKKLKKIFSEHDGFFIASPEYNGFFSPLIKNVLDWLSRSHEENEQSMQAFSGKLAAIASVSPGSLGGIRGLISLRGLLSNLGVIAMPSQLIIPHGFQAFDSKHELIDIKIDQQLQTILKLLIDMASKMNAVS